MAKVYKGDTTGNITELALADEAGGGAGGTVQGTDANTYNIRAQDQGGTLAGDARGENSVDLQTDRNASNQVASGDNSTISGGERNRNSGQWGVISGGSGNVVTQNYGTIGGGTGNEVVSNSTSTIGGGSSNKINDTLSFIGGGSSNEIFTRFSSTNFGTFNAIVGGNTNKIVAYGSDYNFLGGGQGNSIVGTSDNAGTPSSGSSDYCVIVGGEDNKIRQSGRCSIVGGFNNQFKQGGLYSAILGGANNIIDDGDYTSILGGGGIEVGGSSYSIVSGKNITIPNGNHSVFVFADANTAPGYTPTGLASNMASFTVAAGFQIVDGNQGADKVLTCNANGVGTWQAPTLAGLTDTNITVPNNNDVLTWDSVTSKWIAGAATGGAGGTVQGTDTNTYNIQATNEGTVAGNARGEYSVDLQTFRGNAVDVAAAEGSTIGGGGNNQVAPGNDINSGYYSTISGGKGNISLGGYGTVGGGASNITGEASLLYDTIAGGIQNKCLKGRGFVGGGLANEVTGAYCAIVGGENNKVSETGTGTHSFVGGGKGNIADGLYNCILGGQENKTANGGNYNTILGGYKNETGASGNSFSAAGGRWASTGTFANTFAWNCDLDPSLTIIPNAAKQFAIKASGGLRLIDGNETDRYVLTCDPNGVGTWQANPGLLFTDVDATGSTRRLTAGTASGGNSTLSGGLANVASGDSAVIGGGSSNEAKTNGSTIAGGSGNKIYGSIITQSSGSVIVGGVANVIGNETSGSSPDSFIGGGYQNTIGESAAESSEQAVIGGGWGNQIKGNSNLSVIGGGGRYGFGLGSQPANIITDGFAGTIIGGSGNAITGAVGATVLGGEDNLADGAHSVVAGRYANAGGNPGVFVFADSTTVGFTANAPHSAHFGVANGLRVVGPSITLDTSAVVPTVEGHVLTSDANGVGTWQAPNDSVYTVSTLPATPPAGSRAFVTDSNQTHAAGVGTQVVTGGTDYVPVYYNPTLSQWIIG